MLAHYFAVFEWHTDIILETPDYKELPGSGNNFKSKIKYPAITGWKQASI